MTCCNCKAEKPDSWFMLPNGSILVCRECNKPLCAECCIFGWCSNCRYGEALAALTK